MKSKSIEIYLRGAGAQARVAQVQAEETVRDVLLRHRLLQSDEKAVHVFVGDCDEALREPTDVEEGSDEQAPVDLAALIGDLDLEHRRHLLAARCRRVAVSVHYGAGTKTRKFSPATTIETVTAWARKRFHLTDPAADELVLQVSGTNIRPRPDKRLGELPEVTDCGISFELVPEVTPQG
jgi:hypothetical protein